MHPFIAEQLVADRHAQALADADHSRLVRAVGVNRPGRTRRRLGPQWRHRLGIGILCLVAGIATFAAGSAESGLYPSASRLRAEPVNLVGLTAIGSEHVSYDSDAYRTWPAGPDIVGVRVLSGRLSVYGADGERRVYVAGEGYAAGWVAYRAVNETDEPVETVVTNHVQP